MKPLDAELKSLPLCSLAAEAQEKLTPALEGRSIRYLLGKVQPFSSGRKRMVFERCRLLQVSPRDRNTWKEIGPAVSAQVELRSPPSNSPGEIMVMDADFALGNTLKKKKKKFLVTLLKAD